jgi:hypothetical protein
MFPDRPLVEIEFSFGAHLALKAAQDARELRAYSS